ncbi:MAG: NADP-dependent isocitrate dehydrogenase, partial [Marinomonas gallaica]
MSKQTIYYTLTDEAPALATASLLPIFRSFAKEADIELELTDISLAARILAAFSDRLPEDQRVEDGLAFLGELTAEPTANFIKLPNISASIPQLNAAIKELQGQGYDIPSYPERAASEEEKAVQARYAKLLGSAVNPVLRQGNSDRRAPAAVKAFARKHPHSMGAWQKTSQTHADYMRDGDFFSSEQSVTMDKAQDVRIEFVDQEGNVDVKKTLPLLEGEVLDGMRMSASKLRDFFEESLQEAKDAGIMWSLHVKATMMKISHPIVFGHAVTVFYKEVWDKFGDVFEKIGVNPNNGIGSVYDKIKTLPQSQQDDILQAIHDCYEHRPEIAMVDSVRGITNLHVPSDVIVDASMPAM